MHITLHGQSDHSLVVLSSMLNDLRSAAWHGADIILEQVSPESRGIYRFILELHRACDGNWQQFVDQALITDEDLEHLLNYAATFLSNIGNYYVGTPSGLAQARLTGCRDLATANSYLPCLKNRLDGSQAIPPSSTLCLLQSSNLSMLYRRTDWGILEGRP